MEADDDRTIPLMTEAEMADNKQTVIQNVADIISLTVSNLGYPVGMGVSMNQETLNKLAEYLVDEIPAALSRPRGE